MIVVEIIVYVVVIVMAILYCGSNRSYIFFYHKVIKTKFILSRILGDTNNFHTLLIPKNKFNFNCFHRFILTDSYAVKTSAYFRGGNAVILARGLDSGGATLLQRGIYVL